MMELDERKITILKAIIKNYLDTGEPVGSRTISKYSGLNLSSATIRNEMSDLEEMGYIIQPHTSAGRIPSDKGYRFYVDEIMKESDKRVSEVTDMMVQRVDKLEMMLKQLVRSLAGETKYAALISGPSISENKLKYMQLSVAGERQLLLILVLEGNVIKNEVIPIDETPDGNTILSLTIMLNNYLSGLSLNEISPKLVTEIMIQAGDHAQLVKSVLDAAIDMIGAESGDRDIFTSGATNIFKYPELADVTKASQLISAFEEKDALKQMVADVAESIPEEGEASGKLQVFLGGEGPIKNMQDCSLVTAKYELGDGMRGVIGVIGPKRMDYEKVVGTMQNIMAQLDKAFKKDGQSADGEKDQTE